MTDRNPPLPRHWETPTPSPHRSTDIRTAANDSILSILLRHLQGDFRSVIIEIEVQESSPTELGQDNARRGRSKPEVVGPTPPEAGFWALMSTCDSSKSNATAYGIPTTMNTGLCMVPDESRTVVLTIEAPRGENMTLHPQRRQSEAQESREREQYQQDAFKGYVSDPEVSTRDEGWQSCLPFRSSRSLRGARSNQQLENQSSHTNLPISPSSTRDTAPGFYASTSSECQRTTPRRSAAKKGKRRRHESESEEVEGKSCTRRNTNSN